MKLLVTNDTETITAEIRPFDDPTAPDDEASDPWFVVDCRHCGWNSFVNEGTVHATEAYAINDAETHVDHHDLATTN